MTNPKATVVLTSHSNSRTILIIRIRARCSRTITRHRNTQSIQAGQLVSHLTNPREVTTEEQVDRTTRASEEAGSAKTSPSSLATNNNMTIESSTE